MSDIKVPQIKTEVLLEYLSKQNHSLYYDDAINTLIIYIAKREGRIITRYIDEGFALLYQHSDKELVGFTIELDDPEQAWFWSKEWQSGETQVDEDIAAGRYVECDSIADFIEGLDD